MARRSDKTSDSSVDNLSVARRSAADSMEEFDELTIEGKETITSVIKTLLLKCKETPLGTSLV
jgi:precorrin-6B methylase 2